MTMQFKTTGKKIAYRPLMEAELSASERGRAYSMQGRAAQRIRIARQQLRAASSKKVGLEPQKAKWFVLQVEGNREFAVEKHLSDANVEAFMPRETVVKIAKGRKIESERPFFSGYMLVRCVPSPEAFFGLRRVKHVIDIVGGESGYHVVRDQHVEYFRAPQAAPRTATDKDWQEGYKATIMHGPFAGFDCVLTQVTWSLQARAGVLIRLDGRDFEIKSMPIAFLTKL